MKSPPFNQAQEKIELKKRTEEREKEGGFCMTKDVR